MKSYLIIFMLNSFLTYELLVRLTKRKWGHPINKLTIFTSISILLLAVHIGVYFSLKPLNFYEKMEISRFHTPSDLKQNYRSIKIKYHPDKMRDVPNAEEKYIEYREINDYLMDPFQKKVYDKFGLKNDKVGAKIDESLENEFLVFTLAEGGLIYVVFFIFGIILTYDENVKSSRKWFLSLIILAVLTELYYYFFKDLESKDFIDIFFGKLACFERIEIFRFLVGFFANVIRAKYRVFNKVVFDLILEQNEEILEIQKNIQNQIQNNIQNNEKVDEIKKMIERIKELGGEVYENVEKEVKKREEMKMKVGLIKKILKWAVILLMIVGVYNQFSQRKAENVEI